jgi:hypothetical protein
LLTAVDINLGALAAGGGGGGSSSGKTGFLFVFSDELRLLTAISG